MPYNASFRISRTAFWAISSKRLLHKSMMGRIDGVLVDSAGDQLPVWPVQRCLISAGTQVVG